MRRLVGYSVLAERWASPRDRWRVGRLMWKVANDSWLDGHATAKQRRALKRLTLWTYLKPRARVAVDVLATWETTPR